MGVFDSASKKIHNLLGMTALGQKTKATALGVTLASDEDAVAVTDNAGSLTIDSTQLPASLGQKTKAASLPVTLASDEDALAVTVAAGSDVTEGNTTDAAVDTDTTGTVSGKLRGLVKLTVNYLSRFPASLGQKTMAGSLPVTLPSDQDSLPVYSYISGVTPEVVEKKSGTDVGVNTAAYAVGDLMGQKLTFTTICQASDRGAALTGIVVRDMAKQKAAFDVVLFDANPSSTTFTNNGPLEIHAADLTKVIGVLHITAADYLDLYNCSYACVQLDYVIKGDGARTIYAALISKGTPTYTADTDLAIIFISKRTI